MNENTDAKTLPPPHSVVLHSSRKVVREQTDLGIVLNQTTAVDNPDLWIGFPIGEVRLLGGEPLATN